jgi:hypothetical protein
LKSHVPLGNIIPISISSRKIVMKDHVIEFNLKFKKFNSIICFQWHTRMKLIYFVLAINKRIQDKFSSSNYCIKRKLVREKKTTSQKNHVSYL